ncbi:SHOCT domain-containing protein [Nocardia sp. NPDC020380]|uniref:SHOCT domain-containing protein n=1 Tax=Nocardia sp. NPDC020380 TaxID=3364309 RepID=UPI00379D1190
MTDPRPGDNIPSGRTTALSSGGNAMTVGKLSVISWTLFVVMSVAFLPAILGINKIPGLPHPLKIALAVFVVVVVWWGPFIYGMYLAQAAMGNNDKRLLKRGIHGTAVVLSAHETNTMIGGAPDIGRFGKMVYRYRLRVTLPGNHPYETTCRITTSTIREGQTVEIYAAPHNHKRVTIAPTPTGHTPRTSYTPTPHSLQVDAPQQHWHPQSDSTESNRIHQLTELARLYREGSLTAAEFAAEKARLLGN